MTKAPAKTRRSILAVLLLTVLLVLWVLALWWSEQIEGIGTNESRRMAPAPLPGRALEPPQPSMAEPAAEDDHPRQSLRLWLHDPRWVWWSNTVPPMPYADLDLPVAWQDEVGEDATWLALLKGRPSAVAEALEAPLSSEERETAAQAAVALLGALEVERWEHRTQFAEELEAVLPPGETWGSIGSEARQRHHDEGRVARGPDCTQLRMELAELRSQWPDDPYLADIARLVEVRMLLESASTQRDLTREEREAMAVELLEEAKDAQVRVAIAEAIVERAFRPTSMDTVEAVTQAFPDNGSRALNMAMWALATATRLQDPQGMAHAAEMVDQRMGEFCVDEADDWRQQAYCPQARAASMSVMARLAALDGPVVPTTWREAMVTAGWRCARQLGGVRHIAAGTSTVEAIWDGSKWRWGPWPDDPGIGDCMRHSSIALGPDGPMTVDVTVEVGR